MSSTMPSASQTSNKSTEDLENQPLAQQKRSVTKRQREALYALGFELHHAGYFNKAADLFRLLCLYEPENARNWVALGGANQQKKEHEAALAAFLMASFHDPLNPESRLYAAHSFVDLGDLPAALESVQTALHLCENRTDKQEIKLRAFSLFQALKNYIPSL